MDLAQQVRVAILNGTGQLIVAVVTIHDQSSGQPLSPENLLGNAGRAAVTKTKQADPLRAKEPRIAIVPIGAPTRFVGVLNRSAPILQE